MHLAQSSRYHSILLWTSALPLLALSLAAAAQQPAPAKTAPAAEGKASPPTAQKTTAPKPALSESQQKLADDAARLLKLATELNDEVVKTSKDTLSLKVVRQAEVIEKLAKGVKQGLKQATGPS